LVHAIQLVKAGHASPRLGLDPRRRQPSRVRVAQALGVDPSSLLLDPSPSSTAEQAASIARLAAATSGRSWS
jgi:hypothetical protein